MFLPAKNLFNRIKNAQMKRAHKRAMEDRAYAQKSKGDVQVFPSPKSVLETTSFSGSDDHV